MVDGGPAGPDGPGGRESRAGGDGRNGHDGQGLFGALTLGGERNFLDTLRAENTGAVLLLVASVVALVWASSPWSGSYESLSAIRVGPAGLHLDLTVAQWATDGLLAIFFFVVGLELKREFVDGELSSVRTAVVPVIAALGGVAVPACIYVLVNMVMAGGDRSGWAIPAATDIAFAVAVLSVFGSRLPNALRAFLLTLAVADDLVGIVIIAVFLATDLQLVYLAVSGVGVAAFGWLVRRRRRPVALLVLVAVATWWAVHASGIHATIAGVALAFTVPALAREGEPESAAERLEHVVRPVSAGVAVPLFAFFAVGVRFVPSSVIESLASPVGLGIFLGLVVGKPVGIVAATWLATRVTGVKPTGRRAWLDLAAVACVAGIGFTVALLINGLTFGDSAHAHHGKTAILVGSLVAATLGALLLTWRSRARRHHHHHPTSP